MGVRIFRDGNWERIRSGIISRRDMMGLHPEHDRELIGYLIRHAPEASRISMMKYAAEKYGMAELPQPVVNIDDPEDTFYWEYAVLREQAEREDDRDALIAAALSDADRGIAAFAFCRLTGCSFQAGENDAYSYRTFSCKMLPDATAKSITAFCRMMIEKGGPLKDEAEECLRDRENHAS